ncbi:UNVERIFIED_CONTAM: hypothetical protein Sradi_7113500 [Sesamum radiatum]|uniref:DUF4283 domain-containing protein n=1 Tax=Sesamum radiatum TaxID=300843 RepID=A0AAW2IZY2_SESRA
MVNLLSEIVIRPSPAIIEKGSQRWQSTAVGYFLGKKPYFPHLESYARSNWRDLTQIAATSSGFYFFQFKNRVAMEDIIEEGPWLFQGQPIVLQCWEQGMSLRRQKHTQIPVWVRLKHLPFEFWTADGLSTVASSVGIPLYTDKITKSCSRLDFARPVKVFVKKQQITATTAQSGLADDMLKGGAEPEKATIPLAEPPQPVLADKNKLHTKGNDVILYNAFELLNDLDTLLDDECTSSGPNTSSPVLDGT